MLKEIVTKAVVSKGKIYNSVNVEIEVGNEVNKVIGCWVINHHFLNTINEGKVSANGFYDVHVWCATNNNSDTTIYKKTIEYLEEFNLDNNEFELDNSEYKTYCIEYPNCTNLQLVNNKIIVTINKKLAVDVIGESKLLVQVSDGENKEGLGINPNYLNR